MTPQNVRVEADWLKRIKKRSRSKALDGFRVGYSRKSENSHMLQKLKDSISRRQHSLAKKNEVQALKEL